MMSEDFQKFMDRSSRVLERALFEEVDLFAEYAPEESEDLEG